MTKEEKGGGTRLKPRAKDNCFHDTTVVQEAITTRGYIGRLPHDLPMESFPCFPHEQAAPRSPSSSCSVAAP